jgi:hypothetical protein
LKIIYLTRDFYTKVKVNNWTEILHKDDRPYAIVIVKIDGKQFAIPLRHNISRNEHSHYFPTIEAPNEQGELQQCGLDYTKAVIIQSNEIWKNAQINSNEFKALKGKDLVISNQFKLFVKEYIEIVKRKYENKNYPRDYFILKTCTLQYYHSDLGI